MKKLFILLLLTLFISSAFSQKKYKPFSPSEVKKGDLSVKPFKDFSEAKARILFDYGEVKFIEHEDAFKLERTRHLRIKFLDDSTTTAHFLGLTSFEMDHISSFIHYRLIDNNVVTENDLSRWSTINKYTALTKQIENFQKGDILEFQFIEELESPSDIPSWQFEYEIPVDYSEFYAEVPGMFKYRPNFKGYVPFAINSSELLKDKEQNWIEIDGFYVYQNRFLCVDIAPFKKAVYSPSSKTYLTAVDFYLEEIKAYGSYKQIEGKTWEKVANDLYNDEKIYRRIKEFDAKKIVEKLPLDSNKERSIFVIYEWVTANFSWNGDIGIYAEHSLDEVVELKSGSIAEINLLLTALLKEAGIFTSAAVLRTVDQGEVNMEYPGTSQFNYLITWADLNGVQLLMDASEPCLQIGIIRPICLNNRALKITPRFEEWVELDEERYAKRKIITTAFVEDGHLLSEENITKLNYFAYEDCFNFDDFEKLVNVEPGVVVSNIKLSRRDSLVLGNRIKFNCNLDSLVKKNGSSWTFQPFWINKLKESPFVEEERVFPIVFPYFFEYSWTFSFIFDETTSISSFPRSEEFGIPNRTMRFVYEVKAMDKMLQINAQLVVYKRTFEPESYDDIQRFYKKVQEKLTEEVKIKVKQ